MYSLALILILSNCAAVVVASPESACATVDAANVYEMLKSVERYVTMCCVCVGMLHGARAGCCARRPSEGERRAPRSFAIGLMRTSKSVVYVFRNGEFCWAVARVSGAPVLRVV